MQGTTDETRGVTPSIREVPLVDADPVLERKRLDGGRGVGDRHWTTGASEVNRDPAIGVRFQGLQYPTE